MPVETQENVAAEQSTERKQRGIFEKSPGVWWVRYSDAKGKIRREKAPGGLKSAAVQLYRKRKREVETGQKLPENLRRRCVPFSEIADDAFQRAKNKGKRSLHNDEGQIAVLKAWFGDRPADSITPEEISEKLRTGRNRRPKNTRAKKREQVPEGVGKTWSNKTRNDYRGLLYTIFRLAIEAGKCSVNPVDKVERCRVENERTRELLQDEEERLRKVIREKYPWHEPELDFALHTGVRHANMYGLKRKNATTPSLDWQNINLPFKEMSFKGTSMKAGKPLRVPLNDVALAALATWRERTGETGAVIRNEDGSLAHGAKHWFEDAISEAKIEDFTWHDLRHTFATRLRRLGVPLEDIGALLGHSIRSSGFGITARYAHVHMPNLHTAVAKLCAKPEGENATDTTTDTRRVREIKRKAANAN